MEASGSPPKYRFILFYSLNLLAQFDKPYPNELWKISTSEDQTERKKDKPETPRHRDAKITQKRDFETHKKRFRDFEIGPKLSETHGFRGSILFPYLLVFKLSF